MFSRKKNYEKPKSHEILDRAMSRWRHHVKWWRHIKKQVTHSCAEENFGKSHQRNFTNLLWFRSYAARSWIYSLQCFESTKMAVSRGNRLQSHAYWRCKAAVSWWIITPWLIKIAFNIHSQARQLDRFMTYNRLWRHEVAQIHFLLRNRKD